MLHGPGVSRPTPYVGGRTAAEATPSPTILDRLRSETRGQHEAIERDLDWQRRVGDLADYRSLLARLYGFHVVWEPEAAALIADEAFFGPRRKLHLLEADLACLGLLPSLQGKLPRCRPCLPMTTREDALGAMYVLEGSTLGGRLIANRASLALGLKPEAGLAYHGAYGVAVGSMWQAFRRHLCAASSPEADDRIVRSANLTFARLHAWLCR